MAVIVSERKHRELGAPRGLRLMASATEGVGPGEDARAPVAALEKLLKTSNGAIGGRLGLVEVSEASAAQALALRNTFDLDDGELNPDGGAVARGYPLGAASAVSVVRLFTRLVRSADAPQADLRRRHPGRHRRPRRRRPVRGGVGRPACTFRVKTTDAQRHMPSRSIFTRATGLTGIWHCRHPAWRQTIDNTADITMHCARRLALLRLLSILRQNNKCTLSPGASPGRIRYEGRDACSRQTGRGQCRSSIVRPTAAVGRRCGQLSRRAARQNAVDALSRSRRRSLPPFRDPQTLRRHAARFTLQSVSFASCRIGCTSTSSNSTARIRTRTASSTAAASPAMPPITPPSAGSSTSIWKTSSRPSISAASAAC